MCNCHLQRPAHRPANVLKLFMQIAAYEMNKFFPGIEIGKEASGEG